VKNSYFEISEGVLKVRSNISPKKTISGMAIILLAIYIIVITTLAFIYGISGTSAFKALTHLKDPFIIVLFNIIPLAAFVIAPRFPPAAKVSFHLDTRTVKWRRQELFLEIPFEKIRFRKELFLAKTGTSSVGVNVDAIDSKPFLPTDPPLKNPGDKYVKVLWHFYCDSKDEADEMIGIITTFMAGTYDDSPSKFDDLCG